MVGILYYVSSHQVGFYQAALLSYKKKRVMLIKKKKQAYLSQHLNSHKYLEQAEKPRL